MLVKSKTDTRVETLQGKRPVQTWEIFECKNSVYNWLKTMYSKNFEFLPMYVVALDDCIIENKEYRKKSIIEVSFKRFQQLKSLHKNEFIFIETVDDYKKYKIDLWLSDEIVIEEIEWTNIKKRWRPFKTNDE